MTREEWVFNEDGEVLVKRKDHWVHEMHIDWLSSVEQEEKHERQTGFDVHQTGS